MTQWLVFISALILLNACSTSSNQGEEAFAPVTLTEVNLDDIKPTEVKAAYQSDIKTIQPLQLSGVWKSEKPEPAGNGRYAVRELTFTGSRWDLTYTLASDKKMQNILFTHKASGALTVQSPSKRIPGAYLIVYGFNHKTLNIMTGDKVTLKELGFEGCSISLHQEVDITSKGCGIITRLGECPNDYDLLRQETRKDGEFLSLGNKFAEFSACSEDKRPVALGVSLIRVK